MLHLIENTVFQLILYENGHRRFVNRAYSDDLMINLNKRKFRKYHAIIWKLEESNPIYRKALPIKFTVDSRKI